MERDWKAYTAELESQNQRLRAELQQAKEEANLLIQHAPSAIYEFDLQRLRFTRVNDATCQLSGYSREELLSINPSDLLDEAGKALLQEQMRKTFAAEPIDPKTEYKAYTKEGHAVLVELNTTIHYQEGIPASVFVIAHDVTERKKAEEALRESQHKTREILESISDCFFALDRDWRFTYVNQRAARNSGLEPEELIGKNIWDRYPSLNQSLLEEKYRQVMEAREPVHLEYQSTQSGKWYSISVYPTSDGISVYWLDISDRKKAEQELVRANEQLEQRVQERMAELERSSQELQIAHRELEQSFAALGESEARFRALTSASAHVLFRLNPEWSEIRLLQGEELLASTEVPDRDRLLAYIHPDDQPWFMQAVDVAVRTGAVFEKEFRVRLPDGSLVWTTARAVPVRNAAGEIIEWFGAASDITDRKQAEQALERANAELQTALEREKQMHQQLIQSEKYEALARLVASVAHEINNPLQTVRNSLFLLRDSIKEEYDTEFMKIAISETSRISTLVGQLRETYRPAKDLQAVDFKLVDLITDVASLLQAQFRQNHVAFEFIHTGQPTILHGVPDQIKQVLLNIFLNAIDALEERGGQIRVELSRAQDPDRVCVAVHDTGPGIAPDHLNKIFEPFFTTKEKGTGLGLAISYEIIKNHGGEITVESRVGAGATFKIWLPAQE